MVPLHMIQRRALTAQRLVQRSAARGPGHARTFSAKPSSFACKAPLRPLLHRAPGHDAVLSEMRRRIANGTEDPFYVVNLGSVQDKIDLWNALLPEVTPFYAVKCNPDTAMLSLLARNGVNFDCASRAEMEAVLDLGVDTSRILYANPCKQPSHLRFAAEHGVALTVFDSEEELLKTARVHPSTELLLRIQVDDSHAQCMMSNKYGAPLEQAPWLLQRAGELGLSVRGVSFHVGSGCYSPQAFAEAVGLAARVHDMASRAGTPMDMLDIGGGFPGLDSDEISFAAIAAALGPALQEHFPAERGVRVVAEPGRFLAAASHTLAVNVIGKKRVVGERGEVSYMYYVNDGLYGSFNNVLYDHATPKVEVLATEATSIKSMPPVAEASFSNGATGLALYESSMWGPTCDGFDCISKEVMLPELFVGGWLYFRDMGAYTAAAGSTFNGMPLPSKSYMQPLPPKRPTDAAAAAVPINSSLDFGTREQVHASISAAA